MTATQKIIPSGLRPAAKAALDETLRAAADVISEAIRRSLAVTFATIKASEENAIARLNEFTPTESLMDLRLAAAYLAIPKRTLEYLTGPTVLQVPFIWVGGVKRFRKCSLDNWLEEREVRRKAVKL